MATVLKLVLFQILATLATAHVWSLETGGELSRAWYLTGGFMIVNGMLVDAGVITCIVHGWNVGVQWARRFVAPAALTQLEANTAFAVHADMYVADRLQMCTKFIVLAYMYAMALPLIYVIA